MTDVEYSELRRTHLERISKDYFGVDLHVDEIIANDITTGKNSYTTLFRADRQTLYALCEADDALSLSDVKEIIKSMGAEADEYLPPYDDDEYFQRAGTKAFSAIFPSRKEATLQETVFYQNMAQYSPALVRIARIGGEIRRYNAISDRWQKDFDLSYLRMQVQ